MTTRQLIARSLRFHARSHVGVVLGAAIGGAALTGALLVGDSMRGSLREQALRRLDNAWYALAPGDRFFSQRLGERLQVSPGLSRNTSNIVASSAAPLLILPATASQVSGEARANHIQVFG